MAKVTIINGSPKTKIGVSLTIIDYLQRFLSGSPTVFQATQLLENHNEIKTILQSAIVLFVFPLYIDSLPAPLIKLLNLLQEHAEKLKKPRKIKIYAVVNCGFFEAQHNFLALEMLEHFANSCNFTWQYGLAIGCGPGLLDFGDKTQQSPASLIYDSLKQVATDINEGQKVAQNLYISPKMPRLLYLIGGNLGWKKAAKKRGTIKQLRAQPHRQKNKQLR